MGILKGIIDRFRTLGKTENEIQDSIEEAADKATGKNGNFENEQFERCGKTQKHE